MHAEGGCADPCNMEAQSSGETADVAPSPFLQKMHAMPFDAELAHDSSLHIHKLQTEHQLQRRRKRQLSQIARNAMTAHRAFISLPELRHKLGITLEAIQTRIRRMRRTKTHCLAPLVEHFLAQCRPMDTLETWDSGSQFIRKLINIDQSGIHSTTDSDV